ncbi:recombinase family protein [Planococcus sp. ISL-109]|uniref:recombinase family protein n=1 Tax=Planococcus sp. ISL-109 TaxID=2819166 RepID=UPI001BE786F2|nr:recombinase family protein [Planococcus sp. ISL-109]MBT2581350.1 recombinase family protein [Planococcus sp. ISL-109]
MEIGYMRLVSHKTELTQIESLHQRNCRDIRKDYFSSTGHRPELWRLLEEMKQGDYLIVSNLQTIADSLMQLIDVLNKMDSREIHLISIAENLNTAKEQQSSFFITAALLAEFHRKTISLSTKAGLSEARKKGAKVGRPKISSQKIEQALDMYKSKQYTFDEIKKQTDIGKTTIYRYLQKC